MNVVEQAREAYGQAAKPIQSPRQSEYTLISKITRRLRNAALIRTENFPELAAALHQNRSLWATLAANVADTGNELPGELRARLFWLAEFTEEESRQILRGGGDITMLIEINAAVMHGLAGGEAIA